MLLNNFCKNQEQWKIIRAVSAAVCGVQDALDIHLVATYVLPLYMHIVL